jgi:AcrR family transcriptional regulator
LDLAVEKIEAGGEAAIRVNQLAAEAGVTPPVLYYHFGSREGLVIAAQVERYTHRPFTDIVRIERAVDQCTSSDDLRLTLVTTWRRSLKERSQSRWVRTNAFGSAYARPELEAALAAAQDAVVAELVRILEPCRSRGWLRPGIDLVSTVAWHHGLLISRVHIERGQRKVDPDEWDRLTIEALERAFFGP